MSANDKKEEFIFLGKFNIPFIFPVKVLENQVNIRKELNDKLPRFEEGTSLKQGEGYYIHTDIKVTKFIEDAPNLYNILKQLSLIDYNFENYGNIRAFRKDRFVIEKKRLNIGLNNIFWIYPDLLIIKGSKDTGVRFKKSFKSVFKQDIILEEPYTFDPWFIIWIISNYRNGSYELDRNFYMDLIWDMKVEGPESDYIGKVVSAKGSIDVTRSLSILFPLLKKLLPTEFMFSFTIDDLIGTIKINVDGTVLIYLTRGVMSQIGSIDRVVVGCYFIKRLIKLYEKWLKLPNVEKYSSPKFIEDIVRECDTKGIEITSDIMETIEMYEDMRK